MSNKIYNFLEYILFSFVLLSSIFQFYFIHIGESYFSLTLFTSLLLFPFIIKNKNLLLWKPLFFILIIITLQTISFLWSIDLKLGLQSILHFIIFIIITISAYSLTSKYPKKIINVYYLYFTILLILLFFIVFFRIYPLIKLGFLHSDLAKIVINPNIIDGFINGEIRNNIFDPLKSGGFFVNANVASAYLGINAFLCYGFSKAYSVVWLKFISLLLVIGVFFTGSKAGALLVISFMLIVFILNMFINKRLTLQKVIIVLLFINIITLSFIFLSYKILETDFVQNVNATVDIRELIWDFGFREFMHSPLIGLGFGGWQHNFEIYATQNAIDEGFPPHNTLIYLWAESGVFTVLFAILFIISIIKYILRFIESSNKELIGLGIALFGAFSWTFIHGMGTNFGLVGESHMEIILASLLGYTLARKQYHSKRNNISAK